MKCRALVVAERAEGVRDGGAQPGQAGELHDPLLVLGAYLRNVSKDSIESRKVIVLGPSQFRPGRLLDQEGRFPLVGVTAPSVDRVQLRYAEGPPGTPAEVDEGFVIFADASRPLSELVAYDAAGGELKRTDLSHIDMSSVTR